MPKVERLLKFKDTPDGGAVARSTTRGAEYDSGKFVRVDGTRKMTADWDAGGYEIECDVFDADTAFYYGGVHALSMPATNNLLIGEDAGAALTDGDDNVVAGYQAMYFNEEGLENVVLGYQAGYGVTGNTYHNTVLIGRRAGYRITTGQNLVMVGHSAGEHFVDQHDATFVGYFAGHNATGGRQTFVGAYAGMSAGSGNENVAIGWYAGRYIDNGTNNVLVGAEAGEGVTGNDYSGVTAIGDAAGNKLTTGGNHVLVGKGSGGALTSASGCVFLGYLAGNTQTTISNRLMIENSNDNTTPLIYGEFDNDEVGINVGAGCAATLHVDQASTSGAKPVLYLDQADVDEEFIRFDGTSAADQTNSISTVNGDGAVEGPKNFSASAGWAFEGMVRVNVNGTDCWVPYYSADTS